MRRMATALGAIVLAGVTTAGAAFAQDGATGPQTAQAGVSQVEAVSPESLGIYRNTVSDPLDRRYRDGRAVEVFDRNVTVSVQPPSVAQRDFQGNERVRISR